MRRFSVFLADRFGEDGLAFAAWSAVCSFAYSRAMRLIHRLGQHWFTTCYPDGDILLWCQWCGLRHVERTPAERVDLAPAERRIVYEDGA